MAHRIDIEIEFGEKLLRGWLYTIPTAQPWPVIVMAHGFSGVKEQSLDAYAEIFAERNKAVCVFDFPNLGASTGEPRGDIDPQEQLQAFQEVLKWCAVRPEIDPTRLGVWGTSYSGGHVLSLISGETDVRCAVAQVPFVGSPLNEIPAALEALFEAERTRNAENQTMISVVGNSLSALPTPEAQMWAEAMAPAAPNWRNEVTLRSLEKLLHYQPAEHIEKSQVPLLIALATRDSLIPSEMVRAVYERARQPKYLIELDAGHFDLYLDSLKEAASAAADFFDRHL